MDEEDRRQAEYAAYFMDALWARRAERAGKGASVKAEAAPVEPQTESCPQMAMPVVPPALEPADKLPADPPGLPGAQPELVGEQGRGDAADTSSYYTTSGGSSRSVSSSPPVAPQVPAPGPTVGQTPEEGSGDTWRAPQLDKPRVVLKPYSGDNRRGRPSRSRSPTGPPGNFRDGLPGDGGLAAPPGLAPQQWGTQPVQCPPGWWYPYPWMAQAVPSGQAGFPHHAATPVKGAGAAQACWHGQWGSQQRGPRPQQQRSRGGQVDGKPLWRGHLRSKRALEARAAKRAQHRAERGRREE